MALNNICLCQYPDCECLELICIIKSHINLTFLESYCPCVENVSNKAGVIEEPCISIQMHEKGLIELMTSKPRKNESVQRMSEGVVRLHCIYP